MNKTLITLLIGIGIGILIAPAKGSETIERIKDKLQDLKDAVEPEDDFSDERAEHLAN